MDYTNPLGIEYRVVSEAQYQGQPVRIVSGARRYRTTVTDLWDAITNAERLPRWFLPVSGDLELGGRYQLEGHAGGEITYCDPPYALDFTWEVGDNVSWIRLRLESESEFTRLTLEHLIGKDEASEQHWKTYGPGATGVGWDLGFLGLHLYLASGGEAVNDEENNQWLTSAKGKAFLRESAGAWGRAHVEAGEDSDTAKDMARRTAAFYCGEEA